MEEFELTEPEFQQLRKLIYAQTGITLSDAKRHMVKSRLQRRLRHFHLTRFQQYYDLVVSEGENGPEMGELINCITTNKTDFFREPHHFDYVAQQIVPQIMQRAKAGTTAPCLKIWHAGCSTGEEPYTLGITLTEVLSKHGGKGNYRQLASDIDTVVLAKAQRGVYEAERVQNIPQNILRRYFLRGTGDKSDLVQVKRELKEPLTFRQINLMAPNWPITSGTQFDIIFCRNVVIYFDKPTQQKLFARYAQYLRPGGWLFIGHSESLHGVSEAFESVGRTIYRLPERGGRLAEAA